MNYAVPDFRIQLKNWNSYMTIIKIRHYISIRVSVQGKETTHRSIIHRRFLHFLKNSQCALECTFLTCKTASKYI